MILMKPKLLITLVLVAALLNSSTVEYKAEAEPQKDVWEFVVCAAIVVGVGVVVVVGLKAMCKGIPPVPPAPPPPPPTNPPPVINPTNAPPTNPPPKKHWWSRMSTSDNAASVFNISGYKIPDTFSGYYYHTMVSMSLQSSTNLNSWGTEMTITQWVSDGGMFFTFCTNGVPAMNVYTTLGSTNYIPLDIGSGEEPRKFWRVGP